MFLRKSLVLLTPHTGGAWRQVLRTMGTWWALWIKRWATHKICLNRHLNKACSFLGLLKLTRNYLGWKHRGIHWAQEHWHLSRELGKLRPKKIWSRANGRGAGLLALVFKFSGLRSPAIFWPGGTGFWFSFSFFFFFFFFNSNLNWSGCCLQLRFWANCQAFSSQRKIGKAKSLLISGLCVDFFFSWRHSSSCLIFCLKP